MIVKYLPFIRMFLEPLEYTFLFHVTHEETGERRSCFAQGHKEVSEVLAGAGPPPSLLSLDSVPSELNGQG